MDLWLRKVDQWLREKWIYGLEKWSIWHTRRVSRGGTGAAGRSGAREGGGNMGIFGSKSIVWVPENEKLKEKIAEVCSADTHHPPAATDPGRERFCCTAGVPAGTDAANRSAWSFVSVLL